MIKKKKANKPGKIDTLLFALEDMAIVKPFLMIMVETTQFAVWLAGVKHVPGSVHAPEPFLVFPCCLKLDEREGRKWFCVYRLSTIQENVELAGGCTRPLLWLLRAMVPIDALSRAGGLPYIVLIAQEL